MYFYIHVYIFIHIFAYTFMCICIHVLQPRQRIRVAGKCSVLKCVAVGLHQKCKYSNCKTTHRVSIARETRWETRWVLVLVCKMLIAVESNSLDKILLPKLRGVYEVVYTQNIGKTGVTADRDKIEFRLFNSSSIFNITLREELFSLPKKNQTCCLVLVSWC